MSRKALTIFAAAFFVALPTMAMSQGGGGGGSGGAAGAASGAGSSTWHRSGEFHRCRVGDGLRIQQHQRRLAGVRWGAGFAEHRQLEQ